MLGVEKRMVYRISPKIATSYFEDNLIVLTSNSKKVIVLNETAKAIFDFIAKNNDNSLTQIVEYLKEQYVDSHLSIEDDVNKIVSYFIQKGICVYE